MTFEKLNCDNEQDIEEMSRLATSIVREYYDPLLGTEQNDYMLDMFQSVHGIKEQLEHNCQYYFVVDDDNNKIGFFAYYIREDELYLSKLYLIKNQRGKGYSKAILKFLINDAKANGKNIITLNVNKYNKSVQIYEKLGFKRIRAEVNDIGNGYYMDDFVYSYSV
ncbi:MAG: GNAT family N-acetyltransferase [Oscillospiraceae bacterium]